MCMWELRAEFKYIWVGRKLYDKAIDICKPPSHIWQPACVQGHTPLSLAADAGAKRLEELLWPAAKHQAASSKSETL